MKYYRNYTSDKHLAESYDILLEEKKIIDFWTKKKTFQRIQENRCKENNGTFTFHCGPPFPTGSPHSGHILNNILKDIFTRHAYQKGLKVVSQFGWDCHGIAIEHEVNKKLGIKTPEDLLQIGVSVYNKECRKFVQRQEAEWENIFEQTGIWVDLTNIYSTMSTEFMEGVWGVFKQVYDKGLVYRDTKVLPYSTGCFSHLSGFEAEQNCKEISEFAATVSLNIVNSSMKLLIWTTSPWKLVNSLAACVNPNSKYVKVKLIATENIFLVSKSRLPFVFTNSSEYVIVEEIRGKELQNLRYESLFSHFPAESLKTFPVLADKYVRDDLGTGIVAVSPHFGEDDYRVCMENRITSDEVQCPLDDVGRFKENVPEVGGYLITEASDIIIKALGRLGHLIHHEDIQHQMPHCLRSDVPLIKKATTTWFIRVKDLTAKLIENHSQVNWTNNKCKETIWNNFAYSSDWAFARNKYWGTPVPIWSSASGDEIRCIGSIQELVQLTGITSISDLHREFLDKLLIPSSIPGNPPLRRVPDVFDCWFESGTMPFIQGREQVELMVEGLDQTCGWFYTTSILAAALSLPPLSNNIMAHGLVLALDGSKLSKRKHHHSDAIHMAEKYGVDALRLYLATTPLLTGENLILQENEVRKMAEKVMQPLYKILYDLAPRFGKAGWVRYGIITETNYVGIIFDKWILSRTESVMQFIDSELTEYRLCAIIPKIIELIDEVQNWYIPIRHAMVKIRSKDDYTFVLYNVVFKICIMLAPFAPFFTEHVYQILQPYVSYYHRDFVHDIIFADKSNNVRSTYVEMKISWWQMVIKIIRDMRANHIVPIQYRINEIIIVHPMKTFLKDDLLNEILMELVNAHQVTKTTDRCQFGLILKVDLKESSSLHQTLDSAQLKVITSAIRQLNDAEVENAIRKGSFEIEQQSIPLHEVNMYFECKKQLDRNFAISSKNDICVVVRMNKNLDYYEEGTRLEIVSSVKKLRKRAKVYYSELVTVCYSTQDRCLLHAFQKYADNVSKSTNSIMKMMENDCLVEGDIAQETIDIKGVAVTFYLYKSS